MKSVFWILAFLFSLVFLSAAYYVTNSGVRTWVDARVPAAAIYLGPYVRGSSETVKTPSKAAAAPEPAPRPAAPTVSNATPPPAPGTPAPAPPEEFDLKKLATDRSAWPAKVAVAKATDFPAVVKGKVVGSLHAPVGTEVALVTISGGKLGVEYQGGGAWLFVEETDLVARWKKNHN